MKKLTAIGSCLILFMMFTMLACLSGNEQDTTPPLVVFEEGAYPNATLWRGRYYYTMQENGGDRINIYEAETLEQLSKEHCKTVWKVDTLHHIWSPELHRISGKWYLYFEADNDENTDDHQLYVLENTSDNPTEGTFRMKGAIKTNEEWNFGLHPTCVVVSGQLYLLWSGWQQRRSETETQCIYIARMKNPWTLASERVMLSKPDLEWERQWINPNGDRSNYPIFVNENPEAFVTPDGRHVCVCYSASGIWTVYNTLGMLYARTDADLLDPGSWTKSQEPVFPCVPDSAVFGASNISVVPSPDGKSQYLLYESKWNADGQTHRGIRLRKLKWDKEGLPVFI